MGSVVEQAAAGEKLVIRIGALSASPPPTAAFLRRERRPIRNESALPIVSSGSGLTCGLLRFASQLPHEGQMLQGAGFRVTLEKMTSWSQGVMPVRCRLGSWRSRPRCSARQRRCGMGCCLSRVEGSRAPPSISGRVPFPWSWRLCSMGPRQDVDVEIAVKIGYEFGRVGPRVHIPRDDLSRRGGGGCRLGGSRARGGATRRHMDSRTRRGASMAMLRRIRSTASDVLKSTQHSKTRLCGSWCRSSWAESVRPSTSLRSERSSRRSTSWSGTSPAGPWAELNVHEHACKRRGAPSSGSIASAHDATPAVQRPSRTLDVEACVRAVRRGPRHESGRDVQTGERAPSAAVTRIWVPSSAR